MATTSYEFRSFLTLSNLIFAPITQTWGGGSDSYFEYLIKYGRLTNTADATFVNTWKTAVDSSIRYLSTTSTVGNHTYITDYTGGQKRYIGSHLECFHGKHYIVLNDFIPDDIFACRRKLDHG